MRKHHRVIVASIVAGLIVGGGVFALSWSGGQHESASDAAMPNRMPINQSPPAPSGFAGGMVDQATMRSHAAFTVNEGRTLRVYSALALAGSRIANDPDGKDARQDRKSCVVVKGAGFGAATCRHDLFVQSDLLLMELGAGGPAKRDRTELQIAGLASSRVARIEAIDSTGASHTARLQNGAFVVDLAHDVVAAGIEISSISAFSSSGDLLESVSL